MDERRSQRVSEALREELAEMIGYELEDPRIKITDITEVQLSPDGRHAVVRVAIEGTAEEQQPVLDGLEHARHYLRHEVGRRLQMFKVPELHFEADAALGAPGRVQQLLKRIRKGRRSEL